MDAATVPALHDAVLDWYDDHARELPWRGTAASPWSVMVSDYGDNPEGVSGPLCHSRLVRPPQLEAAQPPRNTAPDSLRDREGVSPLARQTVALVDRIRA